MNKGFMATHGKAIVDNGYDIIPIVPENKFPAVKKWPEAKLKLSKWAAMPTKTGIGIRTKHTPAVDVDVRDPVISRQMLKFISGVCDTCQVVRVGHAPKFLAVFKTSKPFKKMRSKKYVDFLGQEHQVEILGDGQFFVAYGIHPSTGKAFKWVPSINPTEVDSQYLPELNPEIAQTVIDYFEEIRPADWTIVDESESGGETSLELIDSLKPPLNVSDEKVVHEVNLIDPDISHDQWVKVGMGIYHQYHGSDEGFEIWDDWSQKGSKYSEDTMLIKWHSFEPDLNTTNPVTFATVMRMTAEKQEPIKTGQFFKHLSDIASNIGSVKFLIKNWVEAQTLVSIFGDPGSFKSFIAIDMACHIATGTPWKGCEVDRGPVIYIAGEGFGGLGKRTLAWCIKNDVEPKDVPVYFSTASADLYNEDSALELTMKIEELMDGLGETVKTIVIDTLARNMGAGDENSTSDMNKFINHIDRFLKDKYGCTVILVHHTGHKDKHRARGSSSLLGALDHNIRCDKIGKLDATLTATKMKDAEEPDPIYLNGESIFLGPDQDGEEMTSLAFSKGESYTKELKPLTEKQTQVLELIKEMSGPGMSVDIAKIDLYRKVETEEVYKQGRRAAYILNNLHENGYIIQTETEVKLKLEITQ